MSNHKYDIQVKSIINYRALDSERIINALRASENAKNEWFKDYWYGVATKIGQKYI